MLVLMLRLTALPLGDWHGIGWNTEKTINRNKLFILVLSFPQNFSCNCAALAQGPQVYRHLQTEKLKQWQGLIDSVYTWLNSLKGLEKPGGHLPMCLQAWRSGHISEQHACIPGFANGGCCPPVFVCQLLMDTARNTLISAYHKSLGWQAYHKPFTWGGKSLSERNCHADPKWVTLSFSLASFCSLFAPLLPPGENISSPVLFLVLLAASLCASWV